MLTKPKISQRVISLREQMGLNQAEFAQWIGLSRNYVSMIEGGREPSTQVMRLIDELEEQWKTAESVGGSAKEKVRRAMASKNIDFKALAKQTGYSAGVLGAIIDGNGKASERMIEKICDALDLDKEEIMAGTEASVVRGGMIGTHGATPDIITGPGLGKARYIPLISMAQAGTMADLNYTDEAYQHEGVLAFDVKDPRAIAIRINGDSMEPKYSPGDIIIVSPNTAPLNGDCVIARLSEREGGDTLFKLHTSRDSGRRVILSSYNPAYPPLEIDRADAVWIYPMVGMIRMASNRHH